MRGLAIAVLLVAGCADRDAVKLAQIKQQVCACKTSACAEQAMKAVPQDDVHPTHRAQGVARQMLDCLSKLYEGERPTTDPDAEESSGPGSEAPASARTP